tara:strand:+ start:67041 stop:68066 length:1026 start_codon:yes stop_codon:yes gene_type:complete
MAVMEETNHLPNGQGRRYHQNGQLAYEGQYVEGHKEGVFHHFDERGTWTKQEFYKQGELLWSSINRHETLSESDFVKPKNKPAPLLLEEDVETPFFVGMRPLALQDGVSIKGSYQEISKDQRTSRAQNVALGAAHDLSKIGLPSFSAYGSLGMTLVQLGSEGGNLVGKRAFELGGRWSSSERKSAVSLGASFPLGGDTLDGYRAEVAGGQLGMDALVGFPRTTSLRSHASHVRRRGVFWLRGDGGLDLVVDTHGDEQLQTTTSGVLIVRLGAAVGVATQRFFLAGQLRTLHSSEDLETEANASVSIEVRQYKLRPGFIVYAPLLGKQSKPGAGLSLTYELD